MKHLIGAAALVVLALVGKSWAFPHSSLDRHGVHATYFVISLRTMGFWLLMGIAAVWLVVAAYRFGRG